MSARTCKQRLFRTRYAAIRPSFRTCIRVPLSWLSDSPVLSVFLEAYVTSLPAGEGA